MYRIITFLYLCFQVTFINTSIVQPRKCALSDSVCITKAAQNFLPTFVNGIPEKGTETLDPLHVDRISFSLAGLNLDVRNIEIVGLKGCTIERINFEPSKKQFLISYYCYDTMTGDYKASGRVLVLPITGDGYSTTDLKKIQHNVTLTYDISKDKMGKDIIDLKNYKFTIDVIEGAHFRLTNLFNGNKQLSDTFLKFLNDNWKEITNEFAAAVLEKPMKKIFTNIKKYLKSTPLEEIVIIM